MVLDPVTDENETTSVPNGSLQKDDAADIPDETDPADDDPNAVDDLTSLVPYSCDGCGTNWKAMGDLYVCRQCFDTQFCAACHVKLRAGELHVITRNKKHDHLYVPPFNRKAWEERDPKMMVVEDNIVPRESWLDGLREQWGLRQDRIDEHMSRLAAQVHAAKVLTRWRRAMLKVRAAVK